MQAATQTRLFVYALIVAGVAYDLCAVAFGWRTISETVRVINRESGWLLGLAWVALAIHFFAADFCQLVSSFVRGLR
ncbi:MAG TPA: hypothetical protein VHQ47_08780 [Phycisphaerae bacterium]|nr:hypothetical protein [Phycisphaerae bacterium]